ncbi:YtxH domain-containing protein [Neobacillus sp.]|uniref:YtxH domain-containing protein n=1 Tax=Neobacillus sp. TaxID=2675273 RepID=UPI00289FAC1A|nr:YtxH domain-containing protein [Neobacillus sp.]
MSNREYESRETNQTRTEESSNSFLLGAIIGGVIGAAAALLLAPKSGKELRTSLTNQAGTIKDKSVLLRENVMNKSNGLVSKTTSLSQGLVQQSSELLNKVKGKKNTQDVVDEESEITYIPISDPKEKKTSKKTIAIGTIDSTSIRKKLEEAQKAFDEEESKVKL